MKTLMIVFVAGFFIQLSGAVIFPLNNLVVSNNCSLPNNPPQTVKFTIRTDSGSVGLSALPGRNSIIENKLYFVQAATNSNQNAVVNIVGNLLSNGANKAYLTFYNPSGTIAGYVTIEIDCVPPSSVIITPDTAPVTAPQDSGPGTIMLPSAITSNSAKTVTFTMTPDTPPNVSPWLTFGAINGATPVASVTPNAARDLTVGISPTGLAVQKDPYLGFLHIRDNAAGGQGAADLTVLLSVTAAATGNAVLPHFAVNGVYVTDLYVVNTAAQTASFSIRFLNDSGNPFSVQIAGVGFVSSFSGALTAGGSAFYEVGDAARALAGGSVRITADPSVAVQEIFRLRQQDNTGTHYYEAAVPATAGSQELVTPFDFTNFPPTGEQIYTGLAITNLDTNNLSNVTCTARDLSGAVIPGAVQVPPIAPGGHWADFNFQPLFGKRGTIDCTGTTVIGATALHAFGTSGAISTLPVVLK